MPAHTIRVHTELNYASVFFAQQLHKMCKWAMWYLAQQLDESQCQVGNLRRSQFYATFLVFGVPKDKNTAIGILVVCSPFKSGFTIDVGCGHLAAPSK